MAPGNPLKLLLQSDFETDKLYEDIDEFFEIEGIYMSVIRLLVDIELILTSLLLMFMVKERKKETKVAEVVV